MKPRYRIIRSLKTLEYKVQYTYLGFFWSEYSHLGPYGWISRYSFNSLSQAEEFVTRLQQEDQPNKWEIVRTYGP